MTARAEAVAAFRPSPEWTAAFEKQAPAAIVGARRYARLRAQALTRLGAVADGDDLVLDTLGDTLEGVLPWDPARVSLTAHVRSAVRTRVKDELRRLTRLRHLPMVGDLDSGDGLDRVEGDASRRVAEDGADQQLDVRASAASLLAALRRAAGDDLIVRMVLEAYTAGFTERGEVLEVTGMKPREFDNARRRIARLLQQLPEGVRVGARLIYT